MYNIRYVELNDSEDSSTINGKFPLKTEVLEFRDGWLLMNGRDGTRLAIPSHEISYVEYSVSGE